MKRKIFAVLVAIALLCTIVASSAVSAASPCSPCNPNPNYGWTVDMTGIEYVKLSQRNIVLEAANPGIPAFATATATPWGYEISGYLWDIGRKPVWGMPPEFAWVMFNTGVIARVLPAYNYGDANVVGIESTTISRKNIFLDPSPANIGVPASVKDGTTGDVFGPIWDLNGKPLVDEIPPIGARVLISNKIVKVVE